MSKKEYNHKEAFCIMTYKCRSCHKTEEVYNTRDGVTPFVLSCRICDKNEMIHIHWGNDVCNPYFKPLRGMRIFLDFTKDRAYELAQKTLEYARENNHYDVPPKDADEYIKAVAEIAKHYMEDGLVDIRVV